MFGVSRPALRKKQHGCHPDASERKNAGISTRPERGGDDEGDIDVRWPHHRRTMAFSTTMDGDSRIPSRYERYHRDVAWKHDMARCRDSIDVPLTGHGRALSLKGFSPAGVGNGDRHSQGWWLAQPARVDEMHDDAAHDGRIHARLPCCLERDGNARCTFTRFRYTKVVAWRQAIAAEPATFLRGAWRSGPIPATAEVAAMPLEMAA
jgi:hypothetical protein